MTADKDFTHYIDRWALLPNGDPIITRSSRLLPVLHDRKPAMLKIAIEREEKWGAGLMIWWAGIGAARVLKREGDAIRLDRATGTRSLGEMAKHGKDDEASRILCETVATLHAPREAAPPTLIPLSDWFSGADRRTRRRNTRPLCRHRAEASCRSGRRGPAAR